MFKICDFKFTNQELEELKSSLRPSEHPITNFGNSNDYSDDANSDGEPDYNKKYKFEQHQQIDSFGKFVPCMKKISNLLNENGFDVIDINENLFNNYYPFIIIDKYRRPHPDGITTDNFEKKEKRLAFEYHYYISNINNNSLEPAFKTHFDNCTGLEVCTFIYYVKCTFESGGDLLLYNKDLNRINKDLNQTNYKDWLTIDPRKSQCICMTGDINHRITKCNGIGVRESIIFQVPTKKYNHNSVNLIKSIEKQRRDFLETYYG